MARAQIQGEARGKTCKTCGQDEWRQWNSKQAGKKVWGCMPCNRTKQRNLRADVAWLLWDSARHRARRQGIAFNITVEDVRGVWPADGRCALSGDRMSFSRGKPTADTPTLERVMLSRGFHPGNICIVSNSEAAIRRHRQRTHKATCDCALLIPPAACDTCTPLDVVLA
jgi:hypothetical protein